MEKENKVSIWIGKSNSENDFQKYLKENYTDDGDFSSIFMNDFNIDYYDNQFKEVLFKENSSKKEVLKDFSYSENFIEKITGVNWEVNNSFVLLYNFEYDKTSLKSEVLNFVGVFDYR